MRRKLLGKTLSFFKSTGKAFTITNAFLKYKKKVYITNLKTPTLYSVLKRHGIPLSQTWEIADESFDPKLMVKVKKELQGFDFKTPKLTVYFDVPNSITGDTDWTQMIIVSAKRPLGEREQLLQLLGSCPKGSYGYYARLILRLIVPLVGDFASDAIHLFFAENIDKIARPYTPELNEQLSIKETERWEKSEDPLAREVGTVLREKGRQRSIRIAVLLDTWLRGESYAKLLIAKKATKQDAEIKSEVERVIKEIDKQVNETASQDQFGGDVVKEQDKVGDKSNN